MGGNFRVKQQQKNLSVTFLDASSKQTIIIPTVLTGLCLCAAGRRATKGLISLCFSGKRAQQPLSVPAHAEPVPNPENTLS